jgi:hypothetical protein
MLFREDAWLEHYIMTELVCVVGRPESQHGNPGLYQYGQRIKLNAE